MGPMDVALICRALGDSNRLQIVGMLTDGEKCACKLLERFDITQPTLSHHMKILVECGLVKVRRQGKWSHYSLDCETLGAFRAFMDGLSCKGEQKNGGCGCL
ncbi:MAG: metalloregulator ArsR/SmtB family transcription factor [Oscillospiraceae bacterium]|nr:metalloregulator ArsR/SmtB family transcription factor [Oscillospiraceae bacterium]